MSTFALIHGGGGSSWDWHLVEPELRRLGHASVAVDLPVEEPDATLRDHAAVVVDAVGGADDVVVVAHSLGGLVGPLACEALGPRARLLVFVAGMVPRPGEPFAAWWEATGHAAGLAARDAAEGAPPDGDVATYLHDVEPGLAAEALGRSRSPQERALAAPWPLDALPATPARFVLCRRDRLFPAAWMRGVVAERLGVGCDEIDTGHMPMLARPAELAALLAAYVDA
jgi:pimeloyl-ACP methyl ester carboxylesterase